MICLEIDENQHKSYDSVDETNRYDNLFMDFSGKYIFIRYNPDKFKVNGKKKNPKFETRMNHLENEIKTHIQRIHENKNTELVEIHKIYFDR